MFHDVFSDLWEIATCVITKIALSRCPFPSAFSMLQGAEGYGHCCIITRHVLAQITCSRIGTMINSGRHLCCTVVVLAAVEGDLQRYDMPTSCQTNSRLHACDNCPTVAVASLVSILEWVSAVCALCKYCFECKKLTVVESDTIRAVSQDGAHIEEAA